MAFKADDKVKYKGNCATFSGATGGYQPAEGVVTEGGGGGITYVRLTSPVKRYPVGSVVGLFTRNLELIEDKEETVTFAVGDRVTVKGYETFTNPTFEGRTGIVTDTYGDSDSRRVKFDDDKDFEDGTFNLKYLVPAAEKPFGFEDIQEGDKIRRTETWDTGSVRVFEGVVTDLNEVRAYTKEALLVGYIHDKDNPHVTYELLERPEPPHWTETKPVGSVGVILDGLFSKALQKMSTDRWSVTYLNGGDTVSRSNADLLTHNLSSGQEEKLTWLN